MENENPVVYERLPDRIFKEEDFRRGQLPIDAREIRDILDPEHPMTLEELKVVQLELIQVDDENNYCAVQFVPTITHCSLATLIGLSIKVQLMRLLPARF
ncbi:MIP18 family protein galla-2 [Caerostris extrusa]|uniref:MIP18 family protein galla-2 n=1 Tax=Caerostris extrusa TaxID=172846 RepID=A0AAV4VCZ4_CAEEX|nr:MIP18 family protein galla-2 [Caerostris extrusa]